LRLYYFSTAEHGLAAIRDRRLKIAEIDQLNDPFEFMGIEFPNQRSYSTMNIINKGVAAQRGILCLSASWNHPLMWSHYAEKHKGICLGFDVMSECEKITYDEQRLKPSDIGASTLDEVTTQQLTELLFRKFKAWEYEKEYRLICRLGLRDPVNNLYFLDFSENLVLKEVIVGCESSVKRQQIEAILGTRRSEIDYFKTRPAKREFTLVRDKRESKRL
jgi:hypothetical protein